MIRIVALLACAVLAAVLTAHLRMPAPVVSRLSCEAYVWQSATRPDVSEAIGRAMGRCDKLHLLAAEYSLRQGRLEVKNLQRGATAYPASATGRVLRLGQSTAKVEWIGAALANLAATVRIIAADGPAEIHLDYDCPTRRLRDYHDLLDALQAEVPDVPVVFTALPDWLGRPAFAALARAHPNYILQVHALALPSSPASPATLCEPSAARRAVAKAAALRVPFRVALPTYGSEILWDVRGRLLDVISEDRPTIASHTIAASTPVIADAPAISAMVASWQVHPPPALTGIVWYRLPVANDRRNWPWITFDAVRQGHPVVGRLLLTTVADGAGCSDIVLSNVGNAPARLPDQIILPATTQAADAVGGYRYDARTKCCVRVSAPRAWPWLQAGESRTIGWLRHATAASPLLTLSP